jgi:hypothetical protein
MYGLWDSRTSSFYGQDATPYKSALTMLEEVAGLAERGVAVEEITLELSNQLIVTEWARGRARAGYRLYPAGAAPYVVVLVELEEAGEE